MSTPFVTVEPARWYRRLVAFALDSVLLLLALYAVAKQLPKGPPPADAMAFYSQQDFNNYFTLVGISLLVVTAAFALVLVPSIRATPGQLIVRLRLVALDGSPPTLAAVLRRWLWALLRTALLMVPGPVIALFVGLVAAAVLRVPFSTADTLLHQAGLPDALRIGVHALSFLALFGALWYVLVHPLLQRREASRGGLTGLDRKSNTTHVLR